MPDDQVQEPNWLESALARVGDLPTRLDAAGRLANQPTPIQSASPNDASATNWMSTGTINQADPTQLGMNWHPEYYNDLPERERSQTPKDRALSSLIYSSPAGSMLPYLRAGEEARLRGEDPWQWLPWKEQTPKFEKQRKALQQYYNDAYEAAPNEIKVLGGVGLPGGPMHLMGEYLTSAARPIASAAGLGAAQAGVSGYYSPIDPATSDWRERLQSAAESVPTGAITGGLLGAGAKAGQRVASRFAEPPTPQNTEAQRVPRENETPTTSAFFEDNSWMRSLPKEWFTDTSDKFPSVTKPPEQPTLGWQDLEKALVEYETKQPSSPGARATADKEPRSDDLHAAIDALNERYAETKQPATQAPEDAYDYNKIAKQIERALGEHDKQEARPGQNAPTLPSQPAHEITYHTPTPNRIAELIKNGDSTDWQDLIEILKQKGDVDQTHLTVGQGLVERLKASENAGDSYHQSAYKSLLANHFKPQLDAFAQAKPTSANAPQPQFAPSKIPTPDWADKELWAKAPQTAQGWQKLVGAGDPLVRELKQFETYEQQGKYSPENIIESKQFTQHLLLDKYGQALNDWHERQAPSTSTPDVMASALANSKTVPAHYAVSNDFGLEVGHYATEAEAKAHAAQDPNLHYYHVPEQNYGLVRDTYKKAESPVPQAKPTDLSQLQTSKDWENYLGIEASSDPNTNYILGELKHYESLSPSDKFPQSDIDFNKKFYKNWLVEKYAPKTPSWSEPNPNDIGYTPKPETKPQFTPSSERWPAGKTWHPDVATENQIVAIKGYTDGEYSQINDYLRGAPNAVSKLPDYNKDALRHLDDITRHSSFDEPVKRDMSARRRREFEDNGMLRPGAEFSDAGFGSFSRKMDYTHPGKGPESGGFTILVDNPGKRFAHVDPHSHFSVKYSKEEGEDEVLAARNTHYRVKSWDPQTGTLHVDVIRPHEVPSLVGVTHGQLENLPSSKMREYTNKEFPWEYREYEKYAADKFPGAFKNAEDFKKKYDAAPLTHLTEQQLRNLDYSTAHNYVGDDNAVSRAHEDFGHRRDTRSIEDDILNGQSAPPIVLKHKGGLRILGGNTRLSMAAAHGYNMPVKVIDITGSQ